MRQLLPVLFLGCLCGAPIAAYADAPDWQIHSNWCANVDNGSSHQAYLAACRTQNQYDLVLACQRDAAKNNGNGMNAINAVTAAGRQAVNSYMANNKPLSCQ